MPELPEVETIRRGLAQSLGRRKLRQITLRRSDLRFPIPVRHVHALCDHRVAGVDRRSKYLLLRFSGTDRPIAIIHLGMSGQLFVDALPRSGRRPEWLRHEHWRMDFGERLLRYVDARRFGALDVVEESGLGDHWLLQSLGPEPLTDAFSAEQLHVHTRRRRVAVKTYLMNARNVVGIGNIYASEACFLARIRPGRGVHRLTRNECVRLVAAVREVLQLAIQAGGTTLRDYVGVDQQAGYFQQSLAVYGRAGAPCAICGTAIKHMVQAARATYYCPQCQR